MDGQEKTASFYIEPPDFPLPQELERRIVAEELAACVREGATKVRYVKPPPIKTQWRIVDGPDEVGA